MDNILTDYFKRKSAKRFLTTEFKEMKEDYS